VFACGAVYGEHEGQIVEIRRSSMCLLRDYRKKLFSLEQELPASKNENQRLQQELTSLLEERQELRGILRTDPAPQDGTATAEFDPQPSLLEAARKLVAELAELRKPAGELPTALEVARLFHAAYEAFAPEFGYVTRKDTRVFDAESPQGQLMQAVCAVVLKRIAPHICKPAGNLPDWPAMVRSSDEWKDVPLKCVEQAHDIYCLAAVATRELAALRREKLRKDLDFLSCEGKALVAEKERDELQAIVDGLEKTKDGVVIQDGMQLYYDDPADGGICAVSAYYRPVSIRIPLENGDRAVTVRMQDCYSSREALEASRDAEKGE